MTKDQAPNHKQIPMTNVVMIEKAPVIRALIIQICLMLDACNLMLEAPCIAIDC
jgi:hypothetical protein